MDALSSTQAVISLPFAKVATLLQLPSPVSAYRLEESCTKTEARGHSHWLGLVQLDWLTRQGVFTRLTDAARREDHP